MKWVVHDSNNYSYFSIRLVGVLNVFKCEKVNRITNTNKNSFIFVGINLFIRGPYSFDEDHREIKRDAIKTQGPRDLGYP